MNTNTVIKPLCTLHVHDALEYKFIEFDGGTFDTFGQELSDCIEWLYPDGTVKKATADFFESKFLAGGTLYLLTRTRYKNPFRCCYSNELLTHDVTMECVWSPGYGGGHVFSEEQAAWYWNLDNKITQP